MARAATELPLQGEGRAASQRLVNRELSRSPGAGHPRRRRIATPAVVGIASLALAGTATAATVAALRDNTDKEFSTLHPDKAKVTSTAPEPHEVVGTVTIGTNLQARLYVTTARGSGRCGLVQDLDAAGSEIDSVGFCGGTSVVWADVVNGALVGIVPDQATSVQLSIDGVESRAAVVHGMFILPPPAMGVSAAEIVGYYGTTRLGAWSVALGRGQ